MYPLLLEPVCKQIIWGGNRLRDEYGFSSSGSNIAEAWTLACRQDGCCVITNGEYAGKTLAELYEANGAQLAGTSYRKGEDFPLLIKLIDAQADLSVQVHPDDAYAAEHESSRGKTEAWYVLDCTEDAHLIYGFNKKITSEEFRHSLSDGTFLEHVNRVKVKKGDFFFIPSGTLHAICGGILLAEVQQNCNTTYRVFDYNRLDNGVPRALHIDKAVDVTLTEPPAPYKPAAEDEYTDGAHIRHLCRCEYFSEDAVEFKSSYSFNVSESSFASLLILNGDCSVIWQGGELAVNKGASILIPAGTGRITLSGNAEVLISTL